MSYGEHLESISILLSLPLFCVHGSGSPWETLGQLRYIFFSTSEELFEVERVRSMTEIGSSLPMCAVVRMGHGNGCTKFEFPSHQKYIKIVG